VNFATRARILERYRYNDVMVVAFDPVSFFGIILPSADRVLNHVLQFQVSTPHIFYACLGGFVVFVSGWLFISEIPLALKQTYFQFGMVSLFLREKVSSFTLDTLCETESTYTSYTWVKH